MQPESHLLSDELFHLVTRYKQAIQHDVPYEKVIPILKAIKQKKKDLNIVLNKEIITADLD